MFLNFEKASLCQRFKMFLLLCAILAPGCEKASDETDAASSAQPVDAGGSTNQSQLGGNNLDSPRFVAGMASADERPQQEPALAGSAGGHAVVDDTTAGGSVQSPGNGGDRGGASEGVNEITAGIESNADQPADEGGASLGLPIDSNGGSDPSGRGGDQPGGGDGAAGVEVEEIPVGGATDLSAGSDAFRGTASFGGQGVHEGVANAGAEVGQLENPVDDDAPPPCQPPIEISVDTADVASYDLAIFTAVGGTGNYRFTLESNRSGALLNQYTGAYLAGPGKGVMDEVLVTDMGCLGDARTQIRVVDDLDIRPARTFIRPEETFWLEFIGGSGQWTLTFVDNQSGASLDDGGMYTAGEGAGTDIISIVDARTGLYQEVAVNVEPETRVEVRPGRLFMPIGSTSDLVFGNVSRDHADAPDVLVTSVGDSATYDTETRSVRASSVGRTVFRIVDRFTLLETTLIVDVGASHTAPLLRSGLDRRMARSKIIGDLDGDGFSEAVVGIRDVSVTHEEDGALYFYRGTSDGWVSEPSQILSGGSPNGLFGTDFEFADWTGDGILDLAVGSPTFVNGDIGHVEIFAGVPGGQFSETPLMTLGEGRNGDWFGSSVAACDFNADGFSDLAIGAPLSDNRDGEDGQNNQGMVHLYLGSPDGLSDVSHSSLIGQGFDDEGALVNRRDLRFGLSLAAGDLDDDGICDLAVGSHEADINGNNQGAVWVYRGIARSDEDGVIKLGGLDRWPAKIYAVEDNDVRSSALGRRLHIANVDDVPGAELLVTQHGHDGSRTNSGAIRIFSPVDLSEYAFEYAPVQSANYSLFGDSGNDSFGYDVAVGRDGSDNTFVVVGAVSDETGAEDEITNSGVAHLYAFDQQQGFVLERSVGGHAAGIHFGESVAIESVSNVDGVNRLLVTAARDSEYGPFVGRFFGVSPVAGVVTPLAFPGQSSGQKFGSGLAFLPTEDGGPPDLVIGAPRNAREPNLIWTGQVWLYESENSNSSGGVPSATVDHAIDRNGADFFGHALSVLDFNGDGLMDLAVSAIGEERPPNSVIEDFEKIGQCERENSAGATYIYLDREGIFNWSQPDFVFYEKSNGGQARVLDAGDFDGDGRQDLLVGSPYSDETGRDAGRAVVVRGRDGPADGTTTILCETAFTIAGFSASSRLGYSGLNLGQFNDDACDDFLVGARFERVEGVNNVGVTRLIYGWSENPERGCPDRPTGVAFTRSGNRDAYFSYNMAAGQFLGNEKLDVVISAPRTRNARNSPVGAVHIVDGAWLENLPVEEIPSDGSEMTINFFDDNTPVITHYGRSNDEQFGYGLATMGDLVLVAYAYRSRGDETYFGGVEILRTVEGTVEEAGVIAGEPSPVPERRAMPFGRRLATDSASGRVAVSAIEGDGSGIATGSVFVFDLTELAVGLERTAQ